MFLLVLLELLYIFGNEEEIGRRKGDEELWRFKNFASKVEAFNSAIRI